MDWIFKHDLDIPLSERWESTVHFLVGRHTGLFLYFPFSLLMLIGWIAGSRRPRGSGWIVAALVIYATFLITRIPFNWQGGGGFIGNRYFVNAYPAFLFLAPALSSAWAVIGCGLGGLFLSTIFWTPVGRSIPAPTMQAHTRNFPYELFPLELELKHVPGYETVNLGEIRVTGRRDVFVPQGEDLWVGPGSQQLWVEAPQALGALRVRLRSRVDNRVHLALADAEETVELEAGQPRSITLAPSGPSKRRSKIGEPLLLYHLEARSESFHPVTWTQRYPPSNCELFPRQEEMLEVFPLGFELLVLGFEERLAGDPFALDWGRVEAPERVEPGQRFTILTRVFNRSPVPWGPTGGSARVKLSYHWLQEVGGGAEPRVIDYDGLRTELPKPVPAGRGAEIPQRIQAPRRPGSYVLELDLLFENVAWFAQRTGGKTLRLPIEVGPEPPPVADSMRP